MLIDVQLPHRFFGEIVKFSVHLNLMIAFHEYYINMLNRCDTPYRYLIPHVIMFASYGPQVAFQNRLSKSSKFLNRKGHEFEA